MVQVNRVCLKILFINRPQFLVDSNDRWFLIMVGLWMGWLGGLLLVRTRWIMAVTSATVMSRLRLRFWGLWDMFWSRWTWFPTSSQSQDLLTTWLPSHLQCKQLMPKSPLGFNREPRQKCITWSLPPSSVNLQHDLIARLSPFDKKKSLLAFTKIGPALDPILLKHY